LTLTSQIYVFNLQAQVKVVLCEADQEIEKAYQMLTKSAISAIDCLLDLNKALIQQNSAITETYAASVNGTGKRERGTQELVEVEQGKPSSVTESVWNCIDSVHARCFSNNLTCSASDCIQILSKQIFKISFCNDHV
jgi:hypothetical protein